MKRQPTRHPVVILAALWNMLIVVACVWLAWQVFNMNVLSIFGKPTDLGKPVQNFIAALMLLPACLGLVGSFQLLLGKNQGRYLSLIVNVAGLALSLFALLGAWGIYDSYERIVDGVMASGVWTLGFALAYGLYWLTGRLESTKARFILERSALAIAGLTLILLLLSSNILGGASYILGQYGRLQTWLLTALAAVFLFFVLRLLALGSAFGESPDQRNAWQGWLMLAPNIIGFLFFFAAPLLLSFYLSFTDNTVGRVPRMIGLSNYANLMSLTITKIEDSDVLAQNALPFGYAVLREFNLGASRYVLGAKDRLFWISLGNTLLFCLMLLPLAIIPALGMALILNSSLPGMHFFRALYFLPSVAAVVGTALIWRWLYTPTTGYISYSLTILSRWFGFADPDIKWLSDPGVVLFSVVLLSAWQVVGYNVVLFLAGLQGVPRALYEASKIDGANPWQRFVHVTLPMIAPTTFFVVITTMVTGLQVFNEPYALFPSRPIPENATTLVYYLYTKGFGQFQFGYASSVAWVLFFIIFTFTFVQFRINRSQAYA